MDNKLVVVYTMKGCPWCDTFKTQLKESNVDFHERDIDDYEEEFNLFAEITGSDYVPAFMLVEDTEIDEPVPQLYAPQVNYENLEEGVQIIKSFIL
jgi:glutaredoxin